VLTKNKYRICSVSVLHALIPRYLDFWSPVLRTVDLSALGAFFHVSTPNLREAPTETREIIVAIRHYRSYGLGDRFDVFGGGGKKKILQ